MTDDITPEAVTEIAKKLVITYGPQMLLAAAQGIVNSDYREQHGEDVADAILVETLKWAIRVYEFLGYGGNDDGT